MSNIKENIANNIVKLRKAYGFSQSQLGEKLNYTDKAISKWERAESTPDINALEDMAKLFNVEISYFFKENETLDIKIKKEKPMRKQYAVMGLCISAVWLIGISAFLYPYLSQKSPDGYWLGLIWAIPTSFLIAFVFGLENKIKYWDIVFASLLLWSGLAAIYSTLFFLGYKTLYVIFIIGVPLQAAVILWTIIRQHK